MLFHAPRRYLNIKITVFLYHLIHIRVLLMVLFQGKEWIRPPALVRDGLLGFDINSAFALRQPHP